MTIPTYDDVLAAAERIRPFVRRTPVFTSATLDGLAGCKLHFKCELFQKTGSFKYRGATNAVQKLANPTGVVTHSSGNHGQALALAAKVRGIPATIVMPFNASPVKQAAILGYGASVVESGPSLAEREAKVAEVQAQSGATIIPPFDHPDVIAGQGTAALELIEEVPELDAVLAPIGGGGLLSGFCLAALGAKPPKRVFGAEPKGSNAASQSLIAGERVTVAQTQSVADGLLANRIGAIPWSILNGNLEAVFNVDEAEIIAAMRLVWERMKLVIEPSAAVGVAAALSPEFREVSGVRNLGIIFCGGNVSLDKLYWQSPIQG